MWRIIMTSLLYVFMVEGRPMEPLEGPLWQDLSISMPEIALRRRPDAHSQRNVIYNPDADYDLLPPQLADKRAITMFSRWSPISSIGKQRTPIRSNPNTFSSQPRDRQHGQPLRWG
ncbi:uncharacterized protein LOC103314778 isoform X2 [Tribolium castaneum]|nr:PREDICTED: uncharacterized protein LOC103314778 [Tribolium castaneum]|eukprot:XP_008199882.1 PREDICTED: uncharacterized protein LOC103314778 [Tribolium castaneum]